MDPTVLTGVALAFVAMLLLLTLPGLPRTLREWRKQRGHGHRRRRRHSRRQPSATVPAAPTPPELQPGAEEHPG